MRPSARRRSTPAEAGRERVRPGLRASIKAKPAAAKGRYIRRACTVSSTMGPGVRGRQHRRRRGDPLGGRRRITAWRVDSCQSHERRKRIASGASSGASWGAPGSVILLDFKGLDVPRVTELRQAGPLHAGRLSGGEELGWPGGPWTGTPYECLGRHRSEGTTAVAYSARRSGGAGQGAGGPSPGTEPALAVKAGRRAGAGPIDAEGVTVPGRVARPGRGCWRRCSMLLQTPATQLVQRPECAVPRDLDERAERRSRRRSQRRKADAWLT